MTIETHRDYPAIECPICERVRKVLVTHMVDALANVRGFV